ncbi:hypothetical protein NPIL_697971 [Nephila pilipes]|uniref:Uncharacterized protein n=1 Tax=Nephila pilipes TaxID=299642 RepID=A0A8X6ULD3_NEPPI|nr:hypothetical protein NPIL_697971 [Nephila pilipes]
MRNLNTDKFQLFYNSLAFGNAGNLSFGTPPTPMLPSATKANRTYHMLIDFPQPPSQEGRKTPFPLNLSLVIKISSLGYPQLGAEWGWARD